MTASRTLLLLLLASAAHAQTTAGRVSGIIKDQTGAVLPGVTVTATDIDTRRQWTTTSNGDGQYVLYPLPAGTYDLEATLGGFQPQRAGALSITVAAVVVRNFVLTVAGTALEVAVVGEATIRQGPTVETTILAQQVESLPLNGRDYNQLVLLAGGAVENIGSGSGRDFGAVAASGNRAFSNDYLIDGAPNNDLYQGRSAVPLSVDSIREFKVSSSVAPAEFGQAGTQVSVVTRSGTNVPHGSAYHYYRGNALEARNPFSADKAQPFSRHQFGGAFGGPVVIGAPGKALYDGHDRTFFFVNYEGRRERQDVLRLTTVPLPEFWRGDFSQLLSRATPIQLRDPLVAGRPAIPGNRLDLYLAGARLSPAARQLQPFWGDPTRPGLANNAVRFARNQDDANQVTARVDHSVRRALLAVRYTDSRADGSSPSLLGTGGGLVTPTDTRNLSIAYTLPIGSRHVNELRVADAAFDSLTLYDDGGLPTVASLGLRGFEPADNLVPPMPRITFSGVDAFTQLNYGGSANFGMASLERVSRTVTLADAHSMTLGRHLVKAGVEARLTRLHALQQTNARGQIAFAPSGTSTLSTGYPFADFTIGIPSSTTEVALKRPVDLRQSEIAVYAQDDWRVGDRWVLSLGLRNETFLSPREEHQRLAIFDPASGAIVVASRDGRLPQEEFLPSVVAKLQNSQGQFVFPLSSDVDAGLDADRVLTPRVWNLGPRVGVAHRLDADGRSVVRGGYGLFFTRYPAQYLLQTIAINPPFAGTFTNAQQIVDGTPRLTLDRPYPASGSQTGFSPAGFDRDFILPRNEQWNVTAERSLPWRTSVSVGYVGNRGTHLFRSANVNAPSLNPETGQVSRPYASRFGTNSILVRRTDGRSIYHAMVLEVRRTGGRSLQLQGNWTWAKGLDDTGETVQAALLDNSDLARDRANSDYVRRHMVKINATYTIPFGRGQRFGAAAPRWVQAAAGGWTASGIWQFASGRYFTPTVTSSGGLSNTRPDRLADGNLPASERSVQRWFDPAAFAPVPAVDPATGLPRFGNAGRNVLLGPGLNVVDAALARQARVRGRSRVVLRLEAFNLFNTPNYDLPDRNLSNTNTVASINALTRPQRQVQFAARFEF